MIFVLPAEAEAEADRTANPYLELRAIYSKADWVSASCRRIKGHSRYTKYGRYNIDVFDIARVLLFCVPTIVYDIRLVAGISTVTTSPINL